MNKFMFLALLLLACAASSAQTIYGETVEALEQRLRLDSSLYGQLTGRFFQDDTTLTIKELATLYYGSAFRPGFNLSQEKRIIEAANSLARKEKMEDALRLLTNFTTKNPASLPAILEKSYTEWLMGDSLQAEKTLNLFARLLQVPFKSGNGESPERAFTVRSTQDEELILNELGFVLIETTTLKRNGQHFQVASCRKEDDPGITRDFYFNIELPMKKGMQPLNYKK